jgi:hypothetical protein
MSVTYKTKTPDPEIASDDFWYDLTDGGYFKPKDFLVHQKDIEEVNDAIYTLMKFKNSVEDLIEEM